MSASRTPSQTVGPFFALVLPWEQGPFVVPPGTAGAIELTGCVRDGMGEPVPDALIELWQADGNGLFPSGRGFRGFARAPTDRQGCYRIVTVKPGPLRGSDGAPHAPHAAVGLFARGLLKRLVTRVYFADEGAANGRDPLLSRLPDDAARATLLARPVPAGYRFDIRLQGEGETVFFDD